MFNPRSTVFFHFTAWLIKGLSFSWNCFFFPFFFFYTQQNTLDIALKNACRIYKSELCYYSYSHKCLQKPLPVWKWGVCKRKAANHTPGYVWVSDGEKCWRIKHSIHFILIYHFTSLTAGLDWCWVHVFEVLFWHMLNPH